MKNEQAVKAAFEYAAERYAAIGVDVNEVLKKMQGISLSLHCWQTDDVSGFENPDGELTGGIQATGNYPGKARNIDEVRADLLKVKSLLPGSHRINLHEVYGDFGGKKVDRDEVTPDHFTSWMQWAKENGLKLDFNSTSFSHPKSGMLTLANPDDSIREFWVEHTRRCRWIADEMGKYQNDPCIMNLWIHDGSKDTTVNRLYYRRLLEQSLDRIFATEYRHMKDCIEAKLFGIGAESYTVGSYDFYLGYGVKHNKIVTLDTGHFHLTESIADKISSLLAMPFREYTSVSIISTLLSIVSGLMSLGRGLHRNVSCKRCSNRLPCCANMRPKGVSSNVSLCLKNARACRGMLFGITSA